MTSHEATSNETDRETSESTSEKKDKRKKSRAVSEVIKREVDSSKPREIDETKRVPLGFDLFKDESKDKPKESKEKKENKKDEKLGELSKEEQAEVAALLLKGRVEVKVPEDADGETKAVEAASAEWIRKIVDEHEDIVDAAKEVAEESNAELDVEALEAALEERAEVDETKVESDDGNAMPLDQEGVIFSHAEEEPDEDENTSSSSSTNTPPPPTPPTAAGGGSGSGGVPPLPPTGRGPFGPDFNAAPMPNALPTANQNTLSSNQQENVQDFGQENHAASAALIGGIVGYFIGRRRGRIRTEKKLLPIQKKLEKQVESVNWKLKTTEKKLRESARENYRLKGKEIKQAKINKLKPAPEIIPVPVAKSESRTKAPEAVQLHTPTKPERIGRVLVSAAEVAPVGISKRATESSPTLSKSEIEAEIKRDVKESIKEKYRDKDIQVLSRKELLDISEKVIVDGTSLRKIYETHLIGEKGLRRLMIEHLNGGDLQKALQREIVEREIDFERDPAMRDLGSNGGGGDGGAAKPAGSLVLGSLIEKAEASIAVSQEEAAFYKAKTNHDVKELAKETEKNKVIDRALITAVTVLAIAVVILFITRR